MEPERHFKTRTTSFVLQSSFGEGKLTVNLRDMVDNIIYEKIYNEAENNHKQIHKKVDLSEIYLSLSQGKEDQLDEGLIRQFGMGQIIQKNRYACYKVQKGGKITVYVTLTQAKTKKDIIYESVLQLSLVRSLTQIEQLQDQFEQKLWNQRESYEYKLSMLKKYLKQQQEKVELLSKVYLDNSKFKVTEQKSQVEYNFFANNVAQYVFLQTIRPQQDYIFKIKIIETNNKQIRIGVVDIYGQQMVKNLPTQSQGLFGSANRNSAPINNSNPFAPGIKLSQNFASIPQFQKGCIVEVVVLRSVGLMQWKIGQRIISQQKDQVLNHKSVILCPFIEISEVGAKIKFYRYQLKESAAWMLTEMIKDCDEDIIRYVVQMLDQEQ